LILWLSRKDYLNNSNHKINQAINGKIMKPAFKKEKKKKKKKSVLRWLSNIFDRNQRIYVLEN
jgi:hypothetical protein